MNQLMFGQICVWLALLGAISSLALYCLVQRGHENLRPWARLSYVMVAQGVVWAAFHLMYLVLTHRYEVNYVAEYSSSDLPTASVFGLQVPFFLISCFWAGQQGTFFLWAIYGSVLGVFFMTRCRRSYEAPAMATVSLVQVFLMLLLAWPADNPFALAQPGHIPADGDGLNILLQNHWMVIHPPIMFLGFCSLVFPFAIGISALVRREYDEWIKVAWPWVLFAWCALGTGLFLGGYWAYTVLGWGGFWGWDNVENSSLIPWLATTALIHGMLLQRARGSMKRANLLFALTPYLFVLYGSFLTRSGILSDFSVHSFAAPARAIFVILIIFVSVFFVGAVALLLSRVRSIPTKEAFEHETSRGFFFIVGAWAIYACSIWVLIGTSWPLISRIWGHPGNLSQPFYNQKLFPIAILLMVSMAITPFLKWRGQPAEATGRVLATCLGGAFVLALILTVGNAFFYGDSLKAPVDALIRSNPSAYTSPATPQPSGVMLGGRTSAAGAVTSSSAASTVSIGGENYSVPSAPQSLPEAYMDALRMSHGYAFPIFAFAAFFCILANGFMVYRITGFTRRSWMPAGGFISHIGVGVLLIGVITSLNYGGDAVLNLDPGQRSETDPGSRQVRFTGGDPVQAFGHSFVFKGYDITQGGKTAVMQIAVGTGDETFMARPHLTYARDGNMVHFPSIRKDWTQDLYVSPIKLPGMGGDPNQEFRFHVVLKVTHEGQTVELKPGVSFAMSGGMRPTDTPALPGTPFQVVLQSLKTPTKDAPDVPAALDLALHREGTFASSIPQPTLHLEMGKSAEYRGYTFHFERFSVDQETKDRVKEAQQQMRVAQVEVSTKPMINLVWLGTFFIIGGGLLAARRRILEARGRREHSPEES